MFIVFFLFFIITKIKSPVPSYKTVWTGKLG